MGRVTINGTVAQFSCKRSIAKELWDAKGNRAKGKSRDELKAVMTHEFADPKLAYIRGLFVFASFTALSFVDIKELTNDRIVEVNGEKWIISKRHKTGVPFDIANVWMNEMELVRLFDVIAPTLRAAIRAVYKSGVLQPCEVVRRIRLPNGYYVEVYAMPMVVALAFRINTLNAARVRNVPCWKGCACEKKGKFCGFH